jgi:Rrf2 family protein
VQITKETDYAIRCVHYLSSHWGSVTMIGEIAKKMCIPKSFLAKILQKLSRAEIVRSYRGINGGFELTRSPENITLLDVIESIEGPVAMNSCAIEKKICRFSGTCSVHPVWIEIRAKVESILREKNFANLVSLSQNKYIIRPSRSANKSA